MDGDVRGVDAPVTGRPADTYTVFVDVTDYAAVFRAAGTPAPEEILRVEEHLYRLRVNPGDSGPLWHYMHDPEGTRT